MPSMAESGAGSSGNLWKLIRALLFLGVGFLGGWIGNEGKHQAWKAGPTWTAVRTDAEAVYRRLKGLWPKESASSVNGDGRAATTESSPSQAGASGGPSRSGSAAAPSPTRATKITARELREAEASLRRGIEFLHQAQDAGTAAGVAEYAEAAFDLLERSRSTFAQALAQQPENTRLLDRLTETARHIDQCRRLLEP